MSKTEVGISTAKGFHDKMLFAEQLINNNWTTLCTNYEMFTDDYITVNLDKGATYLFYVTLAEANDVMHGHTLIMTIPESDEEITESTSFVHKYYSGGSKELTVALKYNVTLNELSFDAIGDERTEVTTIKYVKIMSGV